MKIFLSAPYTFKIDLNSKLINIEYRKWLESILSLLREYGNEVRCCHEREEWGAAIQEPGIAFLHDMASISEADLIIAYLGNPPSTGVTLELGFATALKKKIILLKDEKFTLPYLINGLPFCSNCNILNFSNDNHLYEILRLNINNDKSMIK